ncbi:DUF5317 family protein [Helicovermis profundi]|uniref:DUF5317 domain-containing protein n=1 Tax=Helicovermis profundi TaxID=3065157 RepID=A0AAU9E5N2_9FIRM|nr:hypothetical protein HLPR_02380 [Clostridia bacterium S502]
MYIEAIIIGLIIGKIRKGRLENFANVYFKGLIFIIFSLVVEISPIILNKFHVLSEYYYLVPFISVILMIIGILLNIKKSGMKFILFGAILNIVIMILNGFYMPISYKALEIAGKKSLISYFDKEIIMGFINADQLSGLKFFFSKFIPIPAFYPLAKVMSVGDILITIGIIIFVQASMMKSSFGLNNKMIRFSYNSRL